MREKFIALSFFAKILVFVFGAHFLCVVCLCINHAFHKEPPKKKIAVRTFEKKIVPPAPKAVVAKASKKQVPNPKKASKPKPVAKKKPELPPPSPKKKEPPKKKESLTVDPKIEEEKTVALYGEALIAFFQESLDLPEYGEVTIDLEIDASGHVTRIDVVEEKSKVNEAFLKKQLPELVCPCFNGNQISRNTFAFTVVFKNR